MAEPWRISLDWSIEQIVAHSSGLARGCDERAVHEFQEQAGLDLPLAYLEFLMAVGCHAGEFLCGSDFLFPVLGRLQTGAARLLTEDGGPPLPPSAFVFCGHQGYQFLFFDLAGGPDPEVRHYLEGTRAFVSVAPSFSSWLYGAVLDELDVQFD